MCTTIRRLKRQRVTEAWHEGLSAVLHGSQIPPRGFFNSTSGGILDPPGGAMLFRRSAAPSPPVPNDHTHVMQDQTLDTLLSVRFVQEKLGLASHVLGQSVHPANLIRDYTYSPVHYGHSNDSLTNLQHRLERLTSVSTQRDEDMLSQNTGNLPLGTFTFRQEEVRSPAFSAIPLHIQRRVLHTIARTCPGYSLAGLVTANHHPLCDTYIHSNPNTSPHMVTQWIDARAARQETHHDTLNLPTTLIHHWFWFQESDQNHFL